MAVLVIGARRIFGKDRFRTRREAQVIIEAWRQHYNAVRPHSSLDYLTPHEFKQHHPPIHDHPNRAIPQE